MIENKLRLLVVIINYKTPRLVCDGLLSLAEQIEPGLDRVVIVDNASKDNSITEINDFIQSKGWESWSTILPSEVNGGFSAGNNIGIQSAKAEYYLLLNSDAFTRSGAIELLLKAAKDNPKHGVIGPLLEWPDKRQQVSCFYNLSPINSFLHSAKTGVITKIFNVLNVHEVAIPLKEHGVVEADWLSFACVLLKGEMIQEIGMMDEGYFMYREDNDYCRRATNAGWKLKFESKSRVVHLNKGSSNQAGVKRLPKYYFGSRTRYFLKYYGWQGLLLANVLWSLGRCISRLREVLARKPKAFHSSMWIDIWSGFFIQQVQHGK